MNDSVDIGKKENDPLGLEYSNIIRVEVNKRSVKGDWIEKVKEGIGIRKGRNTNSVKTHQADQCLLMSSPSLLFIMYKHDY